MIYCLWCARRDSNPHDFTHCHLKAARLPIPPRALGRPAFRSSRPGRINGADVTNRDWGYKTRDGLESTEIWPKTGLPHDPDPKGRGSEKWAPVFGQDHAQKGAKVR